MWARSIKYKEKNMGAVRWTAKGLKLIGQLLEAKEVEEWLERAYGERDPGLIKLKTDPIYDNLSSDPRFKVSLKN